MVLFFALREIYNAQHNAQKCVRMAVWYENGTDTLNIAFNENMNRYGHIYPSKNWPLILIQMSDYRLFLQK